MGDDVDLQEWRTKQESWITRPRDAVNS